MIKFSLISLKKDIGRAFFYWLTFFITTVFIFTFFNLIFCEGLGINVGKNDNTLITTIVTLVSIVCLAVGFFANDFFTKNKSKEMAVNLICGGRFVQLVQFLMIQTGILFLLSIPIGIIVGILLVPIINFIVSTGLGFKDIVITVNTQTIIVTFCILLFEVFWCIYLNLGFAYRNTIKTLMEGEESLQVKQSFMKMSIKIHKYVYLVLFILPLLFFFNIGDNAGALLVYSIVGIIGLSGVINKIIVPYIEKNKRVKYINDNNKLIYMGLIKEDIISTSLIMRLLIGSAIVFMTILGIVINDPLQSIVAIISYLVSNILLFMSVMFKFCSQMDKRKKIMKTLNQIGYLESDIKIIKIKEVIGFYGLIAILSLLYIGFALLSLYFNNIISLLIASMMLIGFIIPLVLCTIINVIYYLKQK